MLAFYAGHFDTVELNNTFYKLPTKPALGIWRDTPPQDSVSPSKAAVF